MNPEVIARHSDLRIVFTPIHGTAVRLVPAALRAYGFKQVFNVPEQDITSGDFPTVISPNPEEPAALVMAIEKGKAVNADLIMATDPDADRVGIVVKDNKGSYVLLNGNQTAALLIYYILDQWKAKNKLKGNEYIVKTIVTTELLKKIATKAGVACYDVLTGFKYIAEIIRQLEGEQVFIAGGEESYGYLIGDYVRDKDAVISCAFIAETAAWAKDNGKTLYDILMDIYLEFGLYHEKLLSITRKGKSGLEEIQAMMDGFRSNTPTSIGGVELVRLIDYELQSETDMLSGSKKEISFPISNVLQFFLKDGTKITVRPSGTEPKIKFYFGMTAELTDRADYERVRSRLDGRINEIIDALGLG